jgi:alpha-beta hydrolase superfamily lysophospholipase
MDERTFRDADGVEVFYRRWLPAGEPSLVLLLAHGMSEHSGRYGRLAAALTAHGDAVYALDHRGHGRTASATGVGRAGPSGIAGALSDIGELRRVATADVGAPVVLLGHSMGALLAQAYAEDDGDGLAGLVLSGSPGSDDAAAETAAAVQALVDAGMGDEPLAALTLLNAAFEPARTTFDWLSRDAAEVDAYLADPWCGDRHPMTYGFLAGLAAVAARAMEPAAIARLPVSTPILLLTGGADPVSNGAAAVRALEARLRSAGLAVEAHYYLDARHEIFNETNRDEVTRDLLDWLDLVKKSQNSEPAR